MLLCGLPGLETFPHGKTKRPENQLSDSVGTSSVDLRHLSETRACKSEGQQTASDHHSQSGDTVLSDQNTR